MWEVVSGIPDSFEGDWRLSRRARNLLDEAGSRNIAPRAPVIGPAKG
jgi:hypothetical protein